MRRKNVVSVSLGSSETYATVVIFNVGLTGVKMEDTSQRRAVEPLGYIKGGKFLDHLNYYQLLNRHSAMWH
jgi:hypothetical protein